MIQKVIEGTVVLIILYLVLGNAFGFGQVVGAMGNTYVGAVKALQGR